MCDAELNLVGSRTVAPDERIYNTVCGDRLYMVTFRQWIRFVIDLAQPTNPQILGALKIPDF